VKTIQNQAVVHPLALRALQVQVKITQNLALRLLRAVPQVVALQRIIQRVVLPVVHLAQVRPRLQKVFQSQVRLLLVRALVQVKEIYQVAQVAQVKTTRKVARQARLLRVPVALLV